MSTTITSNYVRTIRTLKELNHEYDLISTFLVQKYNGHNIAGKYRQALLKLQAIKMIAKQFNNGNVWIMGRNTCYRELMHYGFVWNESRGCWLETLGFNVRYETYFDNVSRFTYVQRITITTQV